jgi:exonuclease III
MISYLVRHKSKNIIWSLVNVYGVAQANCKVRFLADLATCCARCRDPFILCGDLKILRSYKDKKKPFTLERWGFIFNAIIDQYGLMELDLLDRLYTWSNYRSNPTFEKIYRFLVSPEWDLNYSQVVRGLNRYLSNHVPLLLSTDTLSLHKFEFRYELC